MSLIRPAKRQHTVSQIVLRQFALRGILTIYDSEQGLFLSKGPRGAFHMPFDQHDPLGSEERWGEIETQMPKLYAALEARCTPGDPGLEAMVHDVLALHWARSGAMKTAHQEVTDQVTRRSMEKLARYPGILEREMLRLVGLHATSAEALDWFNQEIHARVVRENSEEWWSGRNARNFAEARKMMSKWSVQIGYAPVGCELIISDSPVVTVKCGHDGLGPHQGVALGDASEIFMPLSPSVMVALGPEPTTIELGPEVVDRYNELQIRARLRWLCCRPSGSAEATLRATMSVRDPRRPA